MIRERQFQTLDNVRTFFQNFPEPIFYFVSEIEQGLGLLNFHPRAHIICLRNSPLVDQLTKQGFSIFCLERNLQDKARPVITTRQMLKNRMVQDYLVETAGNQRINLLFFKLLFDPRRVLPARVGRQVNILNTSPQLNRRFEDKIEFYHFCQRHALPTAPGEVGRFNNMYYRRIKGKYGSKLVIQFGRGWAGKTSFIVRTTREFSQLKSRYKRKMVRISQFIKGSNLNTLITNACVTRYGTISSAPFKQITGDPRFIRQPLGTCGNNWDISDLDQKVKDSVVELTVKVGDLMLQKGYLGYFGLDFVVEPDAGQVFITENNARLTASAPMFSQLEGLAGQIPLLALHLLEFLDVDYKIDPGKLQAQKAAQSFRAVQLVGRNTQNRSVQGGPRARSYNGIYTLAADQNITYQRPGAFLSDLGDINQFLIFTRSGSRMIKPDEEIFRLQARGEALSGLEKALTGLAKTILNGITQEEQKN